MGTSEFLTKGQLNVRKAATIMADIAEAFGVNTLPSTMIDDKQKLITVYLTLADNGGDDSFIFDAEDTELQDAPLVADVKSTKTETKGQKRRRLVKETTVLFSVTVHDNNPTETIENDENIRVRFVAWGNDLIGHYTTRLVFDQPTLVHEGALRNLRNLKYRKTFTRKGKTGIQYGPMLPRYSINYNDDLITEDFIKKTAAKQQLDKTYAGE